MNIYHPHLTTTTGLSATVEPDWHVLVLFTDDTERDIKGLWGPYSNITVAQSALEELRQWPLDGFWDVRRLNKFIALKAGTGQWTWQTTNTTNVRSNA